MIPRTSRLIMGTKLEMALIFVVSAFSCATVGTATNPATGMAINASGGISFGNLYYSSWASFGCGMGLLVSFMRTERGLDVSNEMISRGKRFRLHCLLIVTTVIVMGCSASSYDAKCDRDDDFSFRSSKFCRRAAFGVSAGCVGCVFSLAVVAMRLSCTAHDNGGVSPNNIIFAVECVSSLILIFFYGFAVAYLTSEEGPGAPLGNLYYSTWITFGLTFFVALSCFEELQAAKLMYSLQTERDDDFNENEGVDGSIVSDHHSKPVDWPDNEIEEAVEPNHQANGFREAAPSNGNRSGSVGEVQI